jgi:hypothetical protein
VSGCLADVSTWSVIERQDYIAWLIQSHSHTYPANFTAFKLEGVEPMMGKILELEGQRNYLPAERRELVGFSMALEVDLIYVTCCKKGFF